jgi:hypothetical protein
MPDSDLLALLGSIDNGLRNGSSMTNANLAFLLLCERLGVDPEALAFDNHAVHDVARKMWGEVGLR